MEKKALLKTAVVRFMLVAAMVLGAALLPGSLLSVRAEATQLPKAVNGTIKLTDAFTKEPVSTSYVDDKGTSHTAQAIPLDAAMTTLGASNKEMWYVVPADTTLTYTGTITLAGNVNLILADGAVMNVGTETDRISGSGISGNGKNLTVYGQSNGENAGILKLYNNTINDTNEYGIYMQDGSFIQNSGKVVADHMINGSSENNGGGIYCENFTVNGGSLDAQSKGSNAVSVRGDITINGGSVTIRSTNTHALLATNGGITINGGSVNAVSESINAAINGCSVTINGGSVSATNKNTDTNYPNAVMATGGDIILGGSGADDSIFAGGYIVNTGYSVKVPEGRVLIDDNGSLYKGTLTPAQIAGKTLRPAYAVTVNIVDSINGKPVEKESRRHGRVEVSPKYFAARDYAGANKEVILTIAPDTGWELASFKIEKADGSTVEASDAGDSPTFEMPAESVTVAVAFSKIPVTASYVAEDGTSKTVQAIPLDKTMTTLGKPGTGGGIWYVVKENITFDEGITFYYDGTAPSLEEKFSTVNLILGDGCTMSVGTQDEPINGGCVFEEHAVLNIYSQEKGTGALEVFGSGETNAINLRMLTIYGGKLIAKTADNTAIYVRGGDLSIHGGNVSVTAGKAAAVGFPEINGEVSGTVLVQGGEFTAESSSEGSGYYTVSGGARFFAGNTIIKGPGISEDVELSYNDPEDSVFISAFAPGKNVTIDSNTHKEFTDGTKLYAGVLSDEQKTEIAGKTLYPGCGVSVQIQSQLGGNEVAEADRHGLVTPSKTLFKLSELTGSDQTVTLTIAPQTGYKLSGMQVVPGYGPAISTTRVSNTQYTFTMPNESVRVQAVFDIEWKMLEQELNEGGTVTLDQDYTALAEHSVPLIISSGKTAILDLAGHTISRNLTSATDNGCVIKVNMGGKLTITDSSSGNTGKITGGFNSGNGGGVYVAKGDPSLNWMGGSLTMLGGQITGNKAAKGGGVYVEQGDQEGYGGSINISGKPVITWNTLTDGAPNSNVGLSSGTSITVIGALTEGADIDVTPSGYEKFAAGGGSYVIADTDLAKFEKDGSATAVAKKDTDGKAYFAEKELTDSMVSAIPAQTWTGSAIEPEVTVKDGDTPLTKDTNYTVAYSNNTDIGTNTATATITGLYNSSAASYYGSVGKTFSIVKAPLTVTANSKTITYGDAPANGGVTYSGLVNSEPESVLGGTLAYAYSYAQYDDVGNNYTITPSGLTSGNYDISFVAGTLTVEQKEVGLTWSGTALTYNGLPQAPTAEATGLVNNDTIGVSVIGAQTNAGTGYTATASNMTGAKVGNYKLPDAKTTTFAIGKAPLTVTAKPKTITYGDAPTNDGVTYSGFVNSETKNDLYGTLDYNYSYTQYGDVGNSYTITPKGLTSTNYEITFATGTMTVEQKEVGLDWSTTPLTFTGSAQAPTATATGLVNDDEIGVTVTVTGEHTNAGNYTAAASALIGDKAGNYKLPDANATTFTIGKAAARTIADVEQSQLYTLTSVSASVAGKMPDDAGILTYTPGTATVTGNITVSDFAVDESGNVSATLSDGTAGDTVTLPVTIGSTNYADSTVNVVVTLIAKTDAGVTMDNQTVTYGDTGVVLSGTVTDPGQNGKWTWTGDGTDVAEIDGETGALTIKKTGTVTVTAHYESDTTIGEATFTLTVDPKPLTITADSASKTFDGTALRKESCTNTALASGDRIVSVNVSGSIIDAGYSSNTASAAVIKNDAGTDVTANYNITYHTGTLHVDKKAVTVQADDKTKVYDGDPATDPELTATVTGAVMGYPVDYTLSREAGQDVGSYEITVTAGYNQNYTVNGTGAKLTITRADPTVTAPTAKALTYSGSAQELVTAGEATGGEMQYALGTETAATEPYTAFIPAATDAGTYYVWYKVIGDANHNDSEAAGPVTVEIGKMSLTITADTQAKIFDGTALRKESCSNTALASGDRIVSVNVSGSIIDAGYSSNTASAAVIKNDAGTDVTANYKITYYSGLLIVSKKAVTVQADDKTKVYDGDPATDPELTATVTGAVEGYPVNYTLSREAGQDIGSYEITATAGNNQNYTVSVTGAKLTITRADPTVTAPTAKALTYSGSAQELVTAGEATGGAMQYALGTETAATEPYTAFIPAATDAGTYYVWYQVVGDTIHNDSAPAKVDAGIAQRPITLTANDQTVDLNEHVASEVSDVTITDGALAEGHSISAVTLTGDTSAPTQSGIVVFSAATIADTDHNDVTANYNVSLVNGALTVLPSYTVTIDGSITGGTVKADKATAIEGETVTLTVTPEEGYVLSSLTVMQGETAITVTDNSFIMPASDVTVTAAFVPVFGPATFTLPAAVKTIEESAFEGNPAMRVVYVHDACTAIGANAFKDCTGLTQIRLPQNCAIDGTAFTGCDGLIAVYAPAGGTTEAWANNSGIPFVAE